MKINDYLSKAVKWNPTGDAEFPYCAVLEGKNARIRINPDYALETSTFWCRTPRVNKGLTFNLRVKPLLTRGSPQFYEQLHTRFL